MRLRPALGAEVSHLPKTARLALPARIGVWLLLRPPEPAATPAAALAASMTPAHHTAPVPLLTTPGTAFPFSAVPCAERWQK